jgi:hypothetical protein
MIICSPWTRGGYVDSNVYDHTCVHRLNGVISVAPGTWEPGATSRCRPAGFPGCPAGSAPPMSGWVSRFLAAIGAGRHKAEADVSYDPVVDHDVDGGTPGPGGSDLDSPADQPHR